CVSAAASRREKRTPTRVLYLLAMGEENAFPWKPRMQAGLLLGEGSFFFVASAMRKQARGSQREGGSVAARGE
ncbi:MAG: hypothetical protein ACPIOQ_58200, partial [Promethearchaeia archaeon]